MRPHPLQPAIMYGPVNSTRLGRSLGINLMPTAYKLCSFNCVYCVYGWTDVLTLDPRDQMGDLPRPEQVRHTLERALESVGDIDYITFSGNGESTLHPRFGEIVDLVVRLRDELRPDTPLAILSNSSRSGNPEVRAAIEKLDRRIMKLDSGTEEAFKRINQPAPEVSYEEILEGLERINGIEIQTMWVETKEREVFSEEIEAWIEKLARMSPLEVQLCTVHHPPADQSIRGLDQDRLREIAEQVEKEVGSRVRIY